MSVEAASTITTAPESIGVTATVWPARRLAWITVGILGTAQFVNAIDRHLINLLVGPIKRDLGISDSNMGLLALSFAILYALMGLVAGRWADSHPRRVIIAIGATVWSVMTIGFGLGRSLGQLFLTRMGVGAGEATLNPSGYSIIADYFPPERRARPMAFFIAGNTLGQAFTLFVGGALIQYLMLNHVAWSLPGGAELKPWQIAFVCAGVPGFLIALLVLAIREPPRHGLIGLAAGSDGAAAAARAPAMVPLPLVGRFFAQRWRMYLPIFLGFGLILMWEMGKNLWAPTFFNRTFGWLPAETGAKLGLLTLVFTSGGTVSAGWAAEWLSRRGYRDATLRAALIGTMIGLPFCFLAPEMPTPGLALLCFCPAYFFGAFPFALAPATISTVTPNQMRAQITALYLCTINLLGAGVGPLYIGALTDHVFHAEGLKYSLSLTAVTVLPVALLMLRLAMREYVRHLDQESYA